MYIRDKVKGKGSIKKSDPKMEVLDDKVDQFIDWFTQNRVEGKFTDRGEYQVPNEMRNFIEKMAVWYELRHPDFEVLKLMPIIDAVSDADIKAFNDSLSLDSSFSFLCAQYPSIVYWSDAPCWSHLHLNKEGFVKMAEHMDSVIPGTSDEDLKGKNIKEIVSMIKEKGIELPRDNGFEQAIRDYDAKVYQREGALDCAMYRIIERGQNRIGSRRAFMFAKTFGRNIDIPMAYGVDLSDPDLRLFVNEYVKAGGSKDLACCVGYGMRSSKYESLPTVTIQELVRNHARNGVDFYTPEEKALHQRLVDALSNGLNQFCGSGVQQGTCDDGVKQLRLERK